MPRSKRAPTNTKDFPEQVLEPKPEVEPRTARKGRATDRELWIEVAVVILFGVLLPLFNALSDLYWPDPPDWPPFNYSSAIRIVDAVWMSALVLYFMWRSGEGFAAFGLVRPRWMDLPLGFAVHWVDRFLLVFLWPLFKLWIGEGPNAEDLSEGLAGAMGHSLLIVSIATGAFAEELLVRGFLLCRLKYLMRSAEGALLVTTFLFASCHVYQGASGFVSAAIGGMVYGVTFLIFKRLWPVVVAHALHNAVAFYPYIKEFV